jgi:hypothetical protein
MSQDDTPGASDRDCPLVPGDTADTSALAGGSDPDAAVDGDARDRRGDRPARTMGGR